MQEINKGIDPAIKNFEKIILLFAFFRYIWQEINIRNNGIQFNRSNHISNLIFWYKNSIGRLKNIFFNSIRNPLTKRIKLNLSLYWKLFLLKNAITTEIKKNKTLIGKAETRKNPPK